MNCHFCRVRESILYIADQPSWFPNTLWLGILHMHIQVSVYWLSYLNKSKQRCLIIYAHSCPAPSNYSDKSLSLR